MRTFSAWQFAGRVFWRARYLIFNWKERETQCCVRRAVADLWYIGNQTMGNILDRILNVTQNQHEMGSGKNWDRFPKKARRKELVFSFTFRNHADQLAGHRIRAMVPRQSHLRQSTEVCWRKAKLRKWYFPPKTDLSLPCFCSRESMTGESFALGEQDRGPGITPLSLLPLHVPNSNFLNT